MKRVLVLICAVAALTASAAQADTAPTPERVVDALKIFTFLDKFYAVPAGERSELLLRYRMTHDGKPATDVKLTLMSGGKRILLPIAADGHVERLPTPAELAAHAQIAVEAPAGTKLSNHLDILTAIKPAQEVSAAECALAVTQVNAAIQKAAGIMAMLAPKVKATTFPGAGSGVAVMADGKTTPLPLIKGAPAYDPDSIKGAKIIRLAKAPSVVSLE